MFETPKTLRLKAIGNSLGIILPKELLVELGVKRKAGEAIIVSRCATSNRLEISAEDPEFRKKLDALRDVIAHYDDAWRELAK